MTKLTVDSHSLWQIENRSSLSWCLEGRAGTGLEQRPRCRFPGRRSGIWCWHGTDLAKCPAGADPHAVDPTDEEKYPGSQGEQDDDPTAVDTHPALHIEQVALPSDICEVYRVVRSSPCGGEADRTGPAAKRNAEPGFRVPGIANTRERS